MADKRRHKRFPLAGSATLTYKVQEENKTIHAMISDISLGGIGLYIDIALEMGTDMSLDITFMATDGTLKTDSIEGRIVYAREISDMYFTGIEFYKKVSDTRQPLLHEHLLNTSIF
jgi:c-di-GMP-binding flagellar brake protein YcgR